MARKYKRMSYQDRKNIEAMCKTGRSVEEIAQIIGIHRATAFREIKRGTAPGEGRETYSAEKAQRMIFKEER